ncbi:hypothetical protein T439DRAFT_324467 [Meredithblackwellia eburnea MCA 4105]
MPVREKVSEKERTRNAKAQKAHRERKAAYIKSLEDKIKELEQREGSTPSETGSTGSPESAESTENLKAQIQTLMTENVDLKAMVEFLRSELVALSTPSSPVTDFSSSSRGSLPSPPPSSTEATTQNCLENVSASAFRPR